MRRLTIVDFGLRRPRVYGLSIFSPPKELQEGSFITESDILHLLWLHTTIPRDGRNLPELPSWATHVDRLSEFP